ncbi:hypothetical protein [Sphingomonas sp. LM7]|uniref:hypothetical protein n=1 Tax=Sphingomonas sp. LM7 TaxID=1938607 RepID=UPI000983FFBF|nr:hypothetical protein [Sphingomonas sp. LM7]AQR73686.1 hypothetical protein BXU08_08585 [Sphingomonas sp. LM7]
MIDSGSMLALLKWAAIALALASALWALLGRKPTVEDEHGRKQLTAAGFVTAALILGGASISAMSFGFETVVKQRERSDAAAKAIADKRAAQEDLRIRNAQHSLLRADARALRAENRADAAEERTARIALAVEERERDLMLARNVSLGAQQNLSRTSLALNQLERLALPLEPLTIESVWELPADAPGMASWIARAAAAVRKSEDAQRAATAAAWRVKPAFVPVSELPIEGGADYPGRGNRAETWIRAHLLTLSVNVSCFRQEAGHRLARGIGSAPKGLRSVGDLRMSFRADYPPTVRYVVASRSLRVSVSAEVPLASMERTGAIISFPDLERGLLLIELESNMGHADKRHLWKLVSLTVASRSREYDFGDVRFSRYSALADRAVFVAPSLARYGRLKGELVD